MKHGYEVFHRDVRVPAHFYVTVLGFRADDSADLDAESDYVSVSRDDLSVGCSRHPDATTTPRKPPTGSEIVLRVGDLPGEYARVLASGWPIEDRLQQRPWGLTDFRLFDPTGQYIRITDTAANA